MISRRAFGGLLASAASFFGLKPTNVEAKAKPKKYTWPNFDENYKKFRDTPYLKRMDFGFSAENDKYWGPGHHFYDYVLEREGMTLCPSWHTDAINEFYETQSHILGPDKRRIRYAEVMGPRGPIVITHDDHLRDQIKDAINEARSKGKVNGTT